LKEIPSKWWKELNEGSLNASRYGHFVDVIKSVLQSFQSSRIAFVKQDANSAAYWLAKEVIYLAIDSTWMEEIILFIYDIINKKLFSPSFSDIRVSPSFSDIRVFVCNAVRLLIRDIR